MCSRLVDCYIIVLLIELLNGTPPEYCLSPLNSNDCHREPKRVFYYYKPGSRCETTIWRGCPTYNLFEDEAECSRYCIGGLKAAIGNTVDDVEDGYEYADNYQPRLFRIKNPCDGTLSQSDCGDEIPVFTYNHKSETCTQELWRGCPSKNIFENETECIHTCVLHLNLTQFQEKLQNIPEKEVEEVNELLDNVINDTEDKIETGIEILKKVRSTTETVVFKSNLDNLLNPTEPPTENPDGIVSAELGSEYESEEFDDNFRYEPPPFWP